MWPDRVSNPGPLTYESGALPIALRGPANSTCNIKLKLFNITWFDLAQYVQRCPRMFRCWQQITHPFSFSEAINLKEKYSHTDRC